MFDSLETKRFFLQEFLEEDIPFIFSGYNHPQVGPSCGVYFTRMEEAQNMYNFFQKLQQYNKGIWWKIVDKQKNEKVGAIGFANYMARHKKTEVCYCLLPQFWKKGIIAETLQAVIYYLQQQLGVHRIESLVEEGNKPSCRLLAQAGFLCEGTLRDYEIK